MIVRYTVLFTSIFGVVILELVSVLIEKLRIHSEVSKMVDFI